MQFDLYTSLWIFIIYAFIGWVTEVVYAVTEHGEFVNRGFLNGPVCPIYGFGALIVTLLLRPFYDNIFLLFITSVILTSLLELITGFILEKIFYQKWWDYSDLPFNLWGYICLRFSLLWGIACIVVIKVINTIVFAGIIAIPRGIGRIVLMSLLFVFTVDLILTIVTLTKMRKYIKRADEMEEKLKQLSENLGEKITESVISLKELHEENEKKYKDKIDEFKEKKEIIEEKYEQLKKSYAEFKEKKIFGHNRIIKAFPSLKDRIKNKL